MNILQLQRLNIVPRSMTGKGDLAIIREKVLHAILEIVAIIVFLAMWFLIIPEIQIGNWVKVGIYLAESLGVILFCLARNLPYYFRTWIVLLALFGSGVYSLYTHGLTGSGLTFITSFAILNAVFSSLVVGLIGMILSIGVVIAYFLALINGMISHPNIEIDQVYSAAGLTETGLYFSVLLILISVTLTFIVYYLSQTLFSQKKLAVELEAERSSLERRVENRTSDLERRVNQIRTATSISGAIITILDTDVLLNQVVNLVKSGFNLYYSGVFLLDDRKQFAVLKAGTGEAGEKMLAANHRLAIGGTSMIGWCISNKKARIALDVGKEAVRFNNPFLPLTHSEMALPIISRNEAIGALTIQSMEPDAFDEDDILVLQGIADNLGAALENARLFQQSEKDLEEIRTLNRDFIQEAWSNTGIESGKLDYSFINPLVPAKNFRGSKIEFPLTLREQVIGRLELETDASELTPDQQDLVDSIILQTALALENARLLHETQRRAAQEQSINQMTTSFTKALNIDDVLRSAAEEIGKLPSIHEVTVHLIPPSKGSTTRETFQKGSGHNGKNDGKEAQ